MSFHKTHLFISLFRKLARLFKALAHPSRVKIFNDLVDGPRSSVDLTQSQPISHAAVCAHLEKLITAGLVSYVDQKGKAYYFLNLQEYPEWLILGLLSELKFIASNKAAPSYDDIDPENDKTIFSTAV